MGTIGAIYSPKIPGNTMNTEAFRGSAEEKAIDNPVAY
jgi:hypothetical protein